MNLRNLEYLVAVAEQQHFSKAADVCFVSQPALSMQIQKLEKYLEIQLLERNNKSVLLTDAGRSVVEKAKYILMQVKELKEIAKSSKDLYCGEFKIGIIPTLAPYLLPFIMQPLLAEFPKLQIYLTEEKTEILLAKLNAGELDAAMIALPIIDASCVAMPLFEEEFFLAVPKTHSFAKKKIICQDELAHKQLLLLEDGHCFREQALTICHHAKAEEYKNFRAASLETLRHMVAAGTGMTLIPKLARKNNDNLAYLEFYQPKPFRKIAMLRRIGSAKELLFNDLIANIQKTIKKQKLDVNN